MGAACRALDIPITGGNVSLYNETDGRGVLPTPVIGIVGLIDDADMALRRAFRTAGDVVILLGESRDELGGSEYLKVTHGLIRGTPPALDLSREVALQRLLVKGAASGLIRSAQDCAEGGLAVALAECCFGTGIGVDVDVPAVSSSPGFADIATLFGESASRVVVSVSAAREAELLALAQREHVPARRIGVATGNRISVAIDGRAVLDEPLADGEYVWSTAIGKYFEPARAIA
jgi:phosphoribosylformylglycinamidine synthase